jgi:hypothetical protein
MCDMKGGILTIYDYCVLHERVPSHARRINRSTQINSACHALSLLGLAHAGAHVLEGLGLAYPCLAGPAHLQGWALPADACHRGQTSKGGQGPNQQVRVDMPLQLSPKEVVRDHCVCRIMWECPQTLCLHAIACVTAYCWVISLTAAVLTFKPGSGDGRSLCVNAPASVEELTKKLQIGSPDIRQLVQFLSNLERNAALRGPKRKQLIEQYKSIQVAT